MTKMQRLERENEIMKVALKSIRNLYRLTDEERDQYVREEGGGMGNFLAIAAGEAQGIAERTLRAVERKENYE